MEGRTLLGEHFFGGEHFGENTFWGENTLGRTRLEGRTLWGEHFFEGEHFGENTFFLLKKLRFDEGRTRVPTVLPTPPKKYLINDVPLLEKQPLFLFSLNM